MKSTNKMKFTLQDLEKGLMLAGYLTPMNANEIQEKNKLAEYDKQSAKAKQKVYFMRAVLAAEIVNKLKDERTFGRVKFQKMVYLCENIVQMHFQENRYKKFAAGPFDYRFMHSINEEFKKQKWFEVKTVKDGNYNKPKYIELKNNSKYRDYYDSYFSNFDAEVQRIISLFRYEKSNFIELIATIFYIWKELIIENQGFQKEIFYEKIYAWSKEKEKYSTADIDKAITWMKDNELTPAK